ncbi:MAG: phosphatidate cytidylyltransferase [Hahellaceae bacterium]|nr:phosphatidate cytidylyltransferase [Hahellaceae bacterium]
MLKQRIITALILAPIAIGGIFFLDPQRFAWFIGFVIVLGAWEWANLAGFEAPVTRWGYAGLIALALFASGWLPMGLVLGLGGLWWVVALLLVVSYPASTNLWQAPFVRLVMGVCVLVPTWKALVFVRSASLSAVPDLSNLWVILYIMLLVWGADVGAYFAGRAWGNKKLAPKVSPGKSWAGVYGGMVSIAIIGCVASALLSLPLVLAFKLVSISLLTGMFSVLGDLLESMLKRHRGIKDSSQLLPGHGGVLDRIDSLTAAIPVFTLILFVLGEFTA